MTLMKRIVNEEPICNIQFNIHKFTSKVKPDSPADILIISCFSEFGCEVMGAMYCIPRLIEENPGVYIIVMGWLGRSYLYKHLVDEFWELKEDFQFLRDKAMAFHHVSKNLTKLEKTVANYGRVISADKLGGFAVANSCKDCAHIWAEPEKFCTKCGSRNTVKSLFSDVKYWKKRMTPIPRPSKEKMEEAAKYLSSNKCVGVIARNRITYGRNLQIEFYEKLIKKIEGMGYSIIWLGEKQCTYPCPVPHITDFSRMTDAKDLELTLAIVSQLKFTIQFWTASTRLASMVGTPFLLFESPDQLFGNGQEAYRMALTTTGKKKLVLSHYLNVYNDNDSAIDLVEECVKEMENGDWKDVIGMVDEKGIVSQLREQNLHRLAEI